MSQSKIRYGSSRESWDDGDVSWEQTDAEESGDGMSLEEDSAADPGEDVFKLYAEELAAIPPCTKEENAALLEKIKAGDEAARARLIEGNLKQALFFVQDYMNQGVPMADLIQEASMELMLLADEGLSGSFEKLLESRIRVRLEEVIKEQKEEIDAEEEMAARVNVLQEVSKRMAEELGREATLTELAGRMQMTEDDVREIMKVTMDALSMSKWSGMAADEMDGQE